MNLYRILSIALIVVLAFVVWYRGRRIKKLEAERPVFDLQKFMNLYEYEAFFYGEKNDEAIVNVCIHTAEDLDVKITVHQELDKEIKEEEKYLLENIHDSLAVERLAKLKRLHHLLP